MVKIAFVMLIYNDDYVLEPVIKAVSPFGQIYVAEGPVRYYQQHPLVPDGTNEILHRLIPNKNIVHGQWTTKNEQCNAMLHLVPDDVDYVWEVDADEVWDIHTIAEIMRLLDKGEVDSMSFRMWSFFGGFDDYMTGFEEKFEVHRIKRWLPGNRYTTHRPPTMLAPDGRPWKERNHWNHEKTAKIGWRFFHYSYVFPSQVKKKAAYYLAHDQSSQIPNWYKDVYLEWVKFPSRRQEIEDRYRGVHNWRPSLRGDCYTAPFYNDHPIRTDYLRDRIERELE